MAAHVSYTSTPAIVQSALLAQGIHSNVYWFDSGGEPQLMIQYDSPIRNRPGYAEMLEKVKQVAAQHFLRIDPPLYTLWIAATDMTTVIGPVKFRTNGTGIVQSVFLQWIKGKQELVWPKESATAPLAYPAPPFAKR